MKLSTLVLSMAALLVSPIVYTKDYIKDFNYKIPNTLNDVCQAYIIKLPEADRIHHQDGCMHVDIELAHTPYPILNEAINQNIDENLIKELNNIAQDIYDYLKESDYTQINHYQQLRNIDIISHSDTLWQVAVDDYSKLK